MPVTTRPLRRRHAPGGLLGAVAAGAGAAVLLAGCAGGQSSGSSSERKDTVVIAYRNQIDTLDPARADYQQTDNTDQLLYDTLIGYDKGKMVPQLATTFTYSPDVSSIDVTLRSGVTFHSGDPLTAKDVVYSLERYKGVGQGIIGQISTYKSATAVDDTHLKIELTQPDSLFMGALSRIYILDSKLVGQHAGSDQAQSWLLNHDAGSGPFALVSASGGTYTASRVDKFWGFDAKRPKTIVLRRIDDQATIRDEILAGNVDGGWISYDDKDAFAGKNVTVAASPDTFQMAIYFNTSSGPTANPAVREAVRLAFDYQGALSSIYKGTGTIANGPLPTNLTCRPDLPTAGQNLDKAKAVLADAGLSGVTLTMRYQPNFPEHASAATLLQSNLSKIGVKLKLEPIAFSDYLTMLSKPKTIPSIMLLGEGASYPDTGVMVVSTFWSKKVGTNRGAYSNPKVDALIKKAIVTPDAAGRCALYEKGQQIVDADYATMPLYTVSMLWAWRSDIKGTDIPSPGEGIAYRSITVGN
jgi:peptide/nickel transport system substrate-binding protein